MRILIVEDEVKIRVGISKLITAHTEHIIVGEAKNGKEGLDMAIWLRPQLIITDIRMPIMNGLEMLEELSRQGLEFHSIILTGYAEFDYARKAIRLGADNYLLKPIGMEDVQKVLSEVEEKIQREKCRMEGTPEWWLRSIMLGSQQEAEESWRGLVEMTKLHTDKKGYVFLGYLEGMDVRYVENCKEGFLLLQEKYPQYQMVFTFMESSQEYICLLQGDLTLEEARKLVERRVYLDKKKAGHVVWTSGVWEHPEKLREEVLKLRKLYPWAMVLGYDHFIIKEEVEEFVPDKFQYPFALENELQVMLCNGNMAKAEEYKEKFQENIRGQKCNPYHIRDSYIKMTNFILNLANEVAQEGYRLIQEQNPIQQLGQAVTLAQLENCFEKMIEILESTVSKKKDIRNYTVNRAIHYIREHYQEVISLEEMAERLDITPEYLSTLFNREVGIKFSTFLKQYRISQAKRLLKGTDMKIYEVAHAVGYGDPKYFNRVFREEIGISPGDYRQS